MSLEHLYRHVALPPLARVRRRFEVTEVADVEARVLETLRQSALSGDFKPGATVAIGVGSRGIADLTTIVRTVGRWMTEAGLHPFVFPAMGSHGGGTSAGQMKMLASVGVTEASVGAPIRSEVAAAEIGAYMTRIGKTLPVYFDRNALDADHVFIVSRIKPHPGFVAPHESGICKMLTIGCGKHAAAETCHRLGYAHFPEIMAGMARAVLELVPGIIGGLAIVENALHRPALIECIPRERLIERDADILQFAKQCMPDLPVRMLHALVVDYMGKNIAGPGMDPNVTGRFLTDRHSDMDVRALAVLNLTDAAHGNANGMGAADYLTRHLFEQIDFNSTYLNGLTDPATTRDVSLPPVMPNDQGAMSMALQKGNTLDDAPLMMRIRDTLTLDRLLVSAPLLEELTRRPDCEVLSEPEPVEFDADGNLADRYAIWDAF